jgi:hypothetical protein
VTVADAAAKTGWELAVSDSLEVLEPPSAAELTALRDLHGRTDEADKPS